MTKLQADISAKKSRIVKRELSPIALGAAKGTTIDLTDA